MTWILMGILIWILLEKSTTIIFRIGVPTILFYQEFLKNFDGISLFVGKSRLLIKIRIPVGKAYGLIAALPEFMIGEFYLHSWRIRCSSAFRTRKFKKNRYRLFSDWKIIWTMNSSRSHLFQYLKIPYNS